MYLPIGERARERERPISHPRRWRRGEARRGVVGLAEKTAGDRLMMVMESANGKMLKGRGKTSYCAKQLAGYQWVFDTIGILLSGSS